MGGRAVIRTAALAWLLSTGVASQAQEVPTDDGVAPCDTLPEVLDRVEDALLEGRLDAPVSTLDTIYASLGCGAPAPRAELARLFLLEGAIHTFVGDMESSSAAFVAANRLIPGFWNSDLGPQLRARYDAANEAPEGDAPDGQIKLDPPSLTMVTLLDGDRAPFPINAAAGLHVVQVAPVGGEVVFGRVVRLLPGQSLTLSTGIFERAALPVSTVPTIDLSVVRVQPRKRHWLVVGASAGGLAIASTAVWHAHTGAMRRAESLDRLNRARDRQAGIGVATWALGTLAATGLTIHVAR